MKHAFIISIVICLIFAPILYSQSGQIIEGKVTDGVLPIVNARVMVRADTTWVTTDDNGRFVLPVNNYPDNPVPVMAGKTDWLNNGWYVEKGKKNITLKLEPVPEQDNPNYEWIAPEPSGGGMMGMMGGGALNCGSCHGNYYERWKQSTMANTTHNTRVLQQYKYAGVHKGQCADCHAPGAAVYNPGQTDLEVVAESNDVTAQGVFCDFCHKIRTVDVSFKPGVQTVKLNRITGPSRRMGMMGTQAVFAYGDLSDVYTEPMEAAYNDLFSKSEFCSSCHLDGNILPQGTTWDYKSVYPDAEPEDFGNGQIVPNQWTYMEWKNWQKNLSADDPNKGQQCQDCHMNWTEDLLPYDEYIVEGHGGMMGNMMNQYKIRRDPSTLHPHTFEGATSKRLQNTAYLFIRPQLSNTGLGVMVSVTNTNTGHRLPTGVTFRSMLLLIEVKDSTGMVLKQTSGPKIPEWEGVGNFSDGNYAGLPGVEYARITSDNKGNLNVPFWQATKIVKDNRPMPMQQNISNFVFDADKAHGFINVKATLIYRKAIKSVAKQYGWDTGDILMEEKTETVYQ